MKFSSEYGQEILTLLFEFEAKFAGKHVERPVKSFEKENQRNVGSPFQRFNSFKEGWTEKRSPVILEVGATTLFQLNQQAIVVARYHFKDIKEIAKVSDCPGGFVIAVGESLRRVGEYPSADGL